MDCHTWSPNSFGTTFQPAKHNLKKKASFKRKQTLVVMRGVPKNRGTILGIPIIRTVEFGCLLGSPYFGKLT